MSKNDFQNHVNWIDGRVRVALNLYYQPERDQHLFDALVHDWVDLLEPYSQDCIERAFAKWISVETHRPSPAHIKGLCNRLIFGAQPAKEQSKEPPKERVTGEQAAQIMREYGL